MEINFSKKGVIVSSIISTIMLGFLAFIANDYVINGGDYGILLLVLSVIVIAICGLFNAIHVKFQSKRIENIVNIALFFLLPIISITMVECLNSVFIYDFYVVDFINTYLLYLLFYGLVYGITGSLRLPYFIFTPIVFIFALANYYIYKFKGSPFTPMDFFSIETAKNVAATYDYTPTYQIAIAVILLLSVLTIAIKIKTPQFSKPTKIASRFGSVLAMVSVIVIFFFTDIFASCGIEPDFWNQTRGYHKSGFLLNFCINTKYIHLNEPQNYDADEIENLISELNAGVDTTTNESAANKPNIICIMNESFSDLSVCGKFETNKEYMPYYNSLKDNCIKGNLYLPIHGSGTSNSEYEFLTGNSTSFFPAGSNAYMLYVKDKTSSLVSTLGNLGYSKTAFHPYYSSGWNRKNVYNFFGFEQFLNITSVIKPSILLDYIENGADNEYLNKLCDDYYYGNSPLLRQYVSDSANYQKVISEYENRDRTKPYFMFNVTMQNHGGYAVKNSNFTPDITLTSTKGNYPKTEQYLSLMKKSDEAFSEIIEYFSNVQEPTIICMFGDHQPSIEEEFYEEIMGTNNLSSLSIEETQKRYITPFIIWANYDIKEEYIDKLSVNYLSSYLLKAAGLPLTEYNKYLLNLSKKLPVVTSIGYIDKDDNYYENGEKTKYSALLENYKKIQYNNAIDKYNEKTALFY